MSFWDTLGAGLNIAAGMDMVNTFDDLGNLANTGAQQIGANAAADTAFTGYGVQTGLGNSTVDAQGNMNLGVGPDAAMQAAAGNLAGMSTGAFGSALGAGAGAAGAYNALMGQNAVNDWMRQGAQQMAPGYNANNRMMGQAYGASQQAMQNAMQDTAGREQEIYNRAMAMQQPGLDAQRASQQAREYAQGRGGVRGSQFGGTAEDAATARAQAQAQNQASFQAMNQAQQEMMNQGALASQFGQMGLSAAGQNQSAANQLANLGLQTKGLTDARYAQAGQLANQTGNMMGSLGSQMASAGQNYYGQSFLPMQQQLAAMEIGGQAADRFQTGQLTGANLEAQAGLTGLEAMINANKVGAELAGNLYGSAASAIGGLQSSDGGFFETLFGGLL